MNLKPAIASTLLLCAIFLSMAGAYLHNRFGVHAETRSSLFHVRGNIQTATQSDLAGFVHSPNGSLTVAMSRSIGGPSTRRNYPNPTIRGSSMFPPSF